MDATTAAKIRRHKFGDRRLTSNSAWTHYNKTVRDEGNHEIIAAIGASTSIAAAVTVMNAQLQAALTAMGTPQGTVSAVIVVASPDKLFIPRSVWMGYINLPTGQLGSSDRTAFQTAEKAFADAAGDMRSAIARIFAVQSVLNDMGNVAEHPNPGGTVVGVKHTPGNQQ